MKKILSILVACDGSRPVYESSCSWQRVSLMQGLSSVDELRISINLINQLLNQATRICSVVTQKPVNLGCFLPGKHSIISPACMLVQYIFLFANLNPTRSSLCIGLPGDQMHECHQVKGCISESQYYMVNKCSMMQFR